MHTLLHGGRKTSISGYSVQFSREEQKKRAQLKKESPGTSNLTEAPPSRPHGGRQMHRIELLNGPSTSFVPADGRCSLLGEGIGMPAGKLLSKGKVYVPALLGAVQCWRGKCGEVVHLRRLQALL